MLGIFPRIHVNGTLLLINSVDNVIFTLLMNPKVHFMFDECVAVLSPPFDIYL